MHMSVRVLFFASCLLMFTSCRYFGNQPEGDVIAKAYDEYLYRSDLEGVIATGQSAADSMDAARQFIDNWIRQQVILHHAEVNLVENRKDFSKHLETYRNSLIVYEYESELIRQKLDTVVSEEEISAFYDANMTNFQLRKNILRYAYVKLPLDAAAKPQVKKARKLLMSDEPDDVDALQELASKSLFLFRPDDENWVQFDDMLLELPLDVYDQEGFLQKRDFVEVSDSSFIYLIRITDYKIKESTSPLSLETESIRNIIINRRKTELINRMQQEVFQQALAKKEFEIF